MPPHTTHALAHDSDDTPTASTRWSYKELLFPGQQPSTPVDVFEGDVNEVDGSCLGLDICDEVEDGFWKSVDDWTRRRVCVTDLPELMQKSSPAVLPSYIPGPQRGLVGERDVDQLVELTGM